MQAGEAGRHRRASARLPEDDAVVDEDLDEFLDVEGVALGVAGDEAAQRWRQVIDCVQEFIDQAQAVGRRQGLQVQVRVVGLTLRPTPAGVRAG